MWLEQCINYNVLIFRLCIQVEFQQLQPQKDPSPIFLFDVSADDTLHTLSLRVGSLY